VGRQKGANASHSITKGGRKKREDSIKSRRAKPHPHSTNPGKTGTKKRKGRTDSPQDTRKGEGGNFFPKEHPEGLDFEKTPGKKRCGCPARTRTEST